MPCTKDSLTSHFKSESQLKHELKVEFKAAMDRQGKKIRAEFLKLCEENRPVRAIKPLVLNNMLRDKFSIGIGAQKAKEMLVDQIKKTSDGLVTWKEFLRTWKQNLQEQGKYFKDVAKFDGPEIGKEKLKQIILEKLERKAVQRGARNTTPSMRHLKVLFKDIDADQVCGAALHHLSPSITTSPITTTNSPSITTSPSTTTNLPGRHHSKE
jgi:hypothetical protein